MVATAIMGVATVGGSLIGASANRSAARTAANAQTEAANRNDQLVRDQMARADRYTEGLTGYAGMGAGALAQQLGLGGPMRSSGTPQPQAMGGYSMAGGVDPRAYAAANPDVAQRAASLTPQELQAGGWSSPEAWVAQHAQDAQARGEQRAYPTYEAQQTAAPSGEAPYEPQYYGDQGAVMPTFDPRPDLGPRPDIGDRPEFYAAQYVDAPDEEDYFGDFEETEYYKWLQDETRRSVNLGQYARGLGNSGGTLKALQDRSGMVASGYRDNWFGQQDSLYKSAIGKSQFASNWNLASASQQNALAQAAYESDRGFTNSLYDIDATRADARYDSDRGFNYAAGADNRNFLAGRFDTRTQDLYGLTGIGTGAINSALGNSQSGTNALIGSNNSRADATGNAAIAGANSTNALLGQGLQGLGYFMGQGGGSALSSFGTPGAGGAPTSKNIYNKARY